MEQKLSINSLKSNILRTIVFIFIGTLVMITVVILYLQYNNFKTYNNKFHTSIHTSIQHTLEHNKKNYNFLLQRLTESKNLKKYIAANDRDKVYEILKPKFDLLKDENIFKSTSKR